MGCKNSKRHDAPTVEQVVENIIQPDKIKTIERVTQTLQGDLIPFSVLLSLTDIDLSQCRCLTGNLDALNSCNQLERVVFRGCAGLSGTLDRLLELDPLCSSAPSVAVSLQILDISGCVSLSGTLDGIESCHSLRYLNVSDCSGVTSTLEPFRNIRKLRTLKMNRLPNLTGSLEPLRQHMELCVFEASFCPNLGKGSWQSSLEPLLHCVLPRMSRAFENTRASKRTKRRSSGHSQQSRLCLESTSIKVPLGVFMGRKDNKRWIGASDVAYLLSCLQQPGVFGYVGQPELNTLVVLNGDARYASGAEDSDCSSLADELDDFRHENVGDDYRDLSSFAEMLHDTSQAPQSPDEKEKIDCAGTSISHSSEEESCVPAQQKLCLDICEESKAGGARAILWTPKKSSNQQFKGRQVTSPENENFGSLCPLHAPKMALDVMSGKAETGTPIILWHIKQPVKSQSLVSSYRYSAKRRANNNNDSETQKWRLTGEGFLTSALRNSENLKMVVGTLDAIGPRKGSELALVPHGDPRALRWRWDSPVPIFEEGNFNGTNSDVDVDTEWHCMTGIGGVGSDHWDDQGSWSGDESESASELARRVRSVLETGKGNG